MLLWGTAGTIFYRTDAVPVTQPTASKHWIRHRCNILIPYQSLAQREVTSNSILHSVLITILHYSLSILTTIFQVNLGQPVFIEAKDDGSGGDNWSYKSCKAPVKSSPPTNQHNILQYCDTNIWLQKQHSGCKNSASTTVNSFWEIFSSLQLAAQE